MKILSIQNLHVSVDEKQVLNGINLEINSGETHAIMGPNGSGKSTLAFTLLGHPKYIVTDGLISFDNKRLLEMPVYKRAQAGLFLAFQYPHEIEGISLRDFLRQSYNAMYANTDKKLSVADFQKHLKIQMELLKIKSEFVDRSLNVGFSGGEKKRAETLQLAVLQPKLIILDEIDSGLDIDSLKIVCDGINEVKKHNSDMSLIVITHYPRILQYLHPDYVHVLQNGKIIRSGDKTLAETLDQEGYGNNC